MSDPSKLSLPPLLAPLAARLDSPASVVALGHALAAGQAAPIMIRIAAAAKAGTPVTQAQFDEMWSDPTGPAEPAPQDTALITPDGKLDLRVLGGRLVWKSLLDDDEMKIDELPDATPPAGGAPAATAPAAAATAVAVAPAPAIAASTEVSTLTMGLYYAASIQFKSTSPPRDDSMPITSIRLSTINPDQTQVADFAVDYGGELRGSDCRVLVVAGFDALLPLAVAKVHIPIRGTNPSKDTAKERLGTRQAQVIAYKESHYQQFDPSGARKGLPRTNPTRDWGTMQLHEPVVSKLLWDWRANVDAGVAWYTAGTHNVLQHYKNKVAQLGPQVTDAQAKKRLEGILTDEDALQCAYYQYYNSGFFWVWDAKAGGDSKGDWVMDHTLPINVPSTGLRYGQDAMNIQKTPPADF